jgi:hypothetical protein
LFVLHAGPFLNKCMSMVGVALLNPPILSPCKSDSIWSSLN